MKNAILVHGWNTKAEYYDASRPSASNDHWYPWVSKQLILKDIHTVSVEMPNGYYPVYETWKKELERYDITPQTTLVGHSCGGGFLVRWLSETEQKVGRVVLVAPWLGLDTFNQPFDGKFFDFEIDRNVVTKTGGVTIMYSSDDDKSILQSVDIIKSKIDGVSLRKFDDKGHFTLKSLKSGQFPELIEEIFR